MKPKRLLNTSENIALNQIYPLLEGSGYRLESQILLRDIIELESSDKFSKSVKTSFNNQSLDFVIFDSEGLPRLIIEFDGPEHKRERQQLADIRKNRFCYSARIPLLRIDDSFVQKYEKFSTLEYITYRFLAWEKEWEERTNQMYEDFEALSESAKQIMQEEHFLDPSIDPSVLFDLDHPMPGTKEISDELLENYGRVTDFQNYEIHQDYIEKDKFLFFNRTNTQFGPFEKKRMVRLAYSLVSNSKSEEVIQGHELPQIEVEIGFSFVLPLVSDYDSSLEAPIEYQLRTGNEPIAFQSMPWISDHELGEHLAVHIAHIRLRDWASKHFDHSK